MAPSVIPPVLAMAFEIRAALSGSRESCSDSADERLQSTLGCTSDPWRAAQAGHRCQPGYRRQVYGPKARCAFPTWRSFLRNQVEGIAAIEMFVVASASFRLLYVVIILAHDRRNIVRTAVTEHPTAAWLLRQVTEAFPWDTAPRYLLRDHDSSYGAYFCNRIEAMGITEVITAPRSPWQNGYVERVIASIRRECLDHIVIFNQRHLRRVLSSYVDYYY